MVVAVLVLLLVSSSCLAMPCHLAAHHNARRAMPSPSTWRVVPLATASRRRWHEGQVKLGLRVQVSCVCLGRRCKHRVHERQRWRVLGCSRQHRSLSLSRSSSTRGEGQAAVSTHVFCVFGCLYAGSHLSNLDWTRQAQYTRHHRLIVWRGSSLWVCHWRCAC